MDFVLWKPSKDDEPGWPSPCGIAAPGRPGWHIECSAMSMATLLEPLGGGLACDDPARNVFDIHGGGIDLVFPHHENEIAQSCCAFGTKRMANIWMHNGFLQVEGEKMSKSLGNFVTIHELLHTDKFGGRSWPGEVLRLAMLRTHYRQPIDWTLKALEEAEATLDRWYDAVGDAPASGEIADGVLEALRDDLNTPLAIANLHSLRDDARQDGASVFAATLRFLGFTARPRFRDAQSDILQSWHQRDEMEYRGAFDAQNIVRDKRAAIASSGADFVSKVGHMLAQRAAARAQKNWVESDRLRDELAAMGVAIKDGKDGTTWELKR
jgi:cysteinyl-tRNA synthetase